MDEFIETTKTIREASRTGYIPVLQEAKELGIDAGGKIGVILFRPEDLDNVKGRLYCTESHLLFVSVGLDGNTPFYEIRKSLSERTLVHSLDYVPVSILGPFDDLPECRRFRDLLEEKKETDPVRLKELFKGFTE